MAGPGAPTVEELAARGVARISLGSAVAQSGCALVDRAVAELLDHGTYTSITHALDYDELNVLLSQQ